MRTKPITSTPIPEKRKTVLGARGASNTTAPTTIAHPESNKRNPNIFMKAPADFGLASL